MISYLSPLQLTNVLWAANISSLIGTLGTQNDNAVNILGGTIQNVALSNSTISNSTFNGITIGSNAQGTKTISTAAPFNSSTFLSYISGTNMIVPSVSAGAIVAGQTLTGTGITSGTTVSSLSTTNTSSFTGAITGTALTVASVASGTIAIGQTITGVGIAAGTVITAGSGLSWTVSPSQSPAVPAGTSITGSSTTWTVTPSQTAGSVTALITTSGYANLTVGVNGDVWYRYS
jgi:hypothetical protein